MGLHRMERIGERLRREERALRRMAETPGEGLAGELLWDNRTFLLREAARVRDGLTGQHIRRETGALTREIAKGGFLREELEGRLEPLHTLPREQTRHAPALMALSLLEELTEAAAQPGEGEAGSQKKLSRLEKLLTSLKLLEQPDWPLVLESLDPVHRLLMRDPGAVYPRTDGESRGREASRVTRLARAWGAQPEAVAAAALEAAEREGLCVSRVLREPRLLAGHFGKHPGKPSFAARTALIWLPPLLPGLAIAAALGLWTGSTAWGIVLGLLTALPLTQLCRSLWEGVLLRLLPENPPPRLALEGGIPPEGRTLVVISALIPDEKTLTVLLDRLELHALSQKEKETAYLLLADFPAADEQDMPEDARLLRAAESGLAALRERGKGSYYVLFRRRKLNERAGKYRGRERKRGALEELAGTLSDGEPRDFLLLPGEELPRDIRFLMALDADSRLMPGSLKRLVGTLLHPCNRDYGLAAPLPCPPLLENASPYAKMTAGEGGFVPYFALRPVLHQALFGEGQFSGKGLIRLSAYAKQVAGRLPENRILSHDLLEGCLLRSLIVSDVTIWDEFPDSWFADAARNHR